MNTCSNKWETMAEIHARTGLPASAVIDAVKAEFKAGLAVCRLLDDPDGYGQMIEFRRKP